MIEISPEQVMHELRLQLELRGQTQVAICADTTPQAINDIAHGRRALSDKVLRWLGYERVRVIRRLES